MKKKWRKQDYYAARGVPTELLDALALREAEPNLRDGLAGGLLVPGDAVIYPPCAARWLLQQALARGAQLHQGRAVAGILADGVRLTDGTVLNAARVVNATGSWSPKLTPGLAVRKRKGHLLITDRYPQFLRHQVVELGYLKSAHSVTADSVAFNVQPRKTGQILIGSSRQFGAEDSRTEAGMLARMLDRAREYMPRIANLSAIRSWTGFRAATPDKLPLIGPAAAVNDGAKLFLATGHEGLGITTSLGTARLLADQLLGRGSAIPVEPYLPTRAFSETAHV
jgi:glycine/D-amino acid oxidase-like deaminating enzyme